jgi:hypothetical protein
MRRERDSWDKTGSDRNKGGDVSGIQTLKPLAEAVFQRDRPWDNRSSSPPNLVPTMLKERDAAWDKRRQKTSPACGRLFPLNHHLELGER